MIKRTVVLALVSLALVFSPAGLSTVSAQTKTLTPKIPAKPVAGAMRAEYKISAESFYVAGKSYGFNINCHSLSFGSTCKREFLSEGRLRLIAGANPSLIGSKCDFTLFEPAQLKNGFVFKSFVGQSRPGGNQRGVIELRTAPVQGSTSVKFVFHGWAEPAAVAEYILETITLEGPAGHDWREAVR